MGRGTSRPLAVTQASAEATGKRYALGIRVTRRAYEQVMAATRRSGRSAASEIEHVLSEHFRRNRIAAIIARLEEFGWELGIDDMALDDPDQFNRLRGRWEAYLDSITPPRAAPDEAQVRKELAELRRDIEETPPGNARRRLREFARKLAEDPDSTLSPKEKLAYALLAEEEDAA